MELYIDTANIDEIREAAALGVLDGVTTNPSLVAKEGVDFHDRLAEICEVVTGPVSAEVVATHWDGMVQEGRELAAIDPHIVVKVPFGKAGVQACHTLANEGTRVNVTLIFSPAQALLAAKVGAAFVSPFVGRLDDIGTAGMDLIAQIVEIFENFDFSTEVLVASIRGPIHVIEAARMGADVCTCPPKAIAALFNHPLTEIGLEKFLADWAKAQQPA